jgi:actin-related protein
MFPGIADRMQKELTSLSPSSMKVRRLKDQLNDLQLIKFSSRTGQDCRSS